MKILIDARMYGLENTGIGRYTMKLIENLKIDKTNNYIIFLRKKYYNTLNLPGNFQKALVDIPHYSFSEQIKLPKIIESYNPDLVHFLHFNVPLSFNKKFVVTIHDMIMHSQKKGSTNLFIPLFFIKHALYRRVFKHAVLKSKKIITPSEFVKDEIISYYKIPKEKIIVTYEGI